MALVGKPIHLAWTGRFVGNCHFDQAGREQGLEHLVPKLGPVGPVYNSHEIAYSAFLHALPKNGNLVPAWSRLGPNRRRDFLIHLLNDLRGLATDGDHEATAVFAKFGFAQFGVPAPFNHIADAGAHAFDVFGQVKRLGEQRVAGKGSVGVAQLLEGECGRQSARIPDFEPVSEQASLGHWRCWCSRDEPRH